MRLFTRLNVFLCIVNGVAHFLAFAVVSYVAAFGENLKFHQSFFLFLSGIFMGGIFGYLPARIICMAHSKDYRTKLQNSGHQDRINIIKFLSNVAIPPLQVIIFFIFVFCTIPKVTAYYKEYF